MNLSPLSPGLTSLEAGQSLTSGRPRRKRRPNPLYVQSSDEQDTAGPEVHGHKTKRRKKYQGENKKTALNESDTPPAKGKAEVLLLWFDNKMSICSYISIKSFSRQLCDK